jgi:bile acid:Na+ symporter, BASS family
MALSLDEAAIFLGQEGLGALTASLALVTFGVALHLRPANFLQVWEQPRAVLTGLGSQFVLLPALTVLLVHLWRPPESVGLGMLLVACCPGGNISNYLSLLARANAALSISMTATGSLLALVLTPLNMQLWTRALPRASQQLPEALIQSGQDGAAAGLAVQVQLDPWQMMLSLGLMLVLPLVAGMLLNGRAPDTAARLRRPLSRLSLVIFAAMVLIAVFSNTDIFFQYASRILGLVVVHNVLAFGAGWALARLLGLGSADTRAIALETGIQNAAVALVLVYAHFQGLGGMVLVAAFWGVWHLVAGLALARWLGRSRSST